MSRFDSALFTPLSRTLRSPRPLIACCLFALASTQIACAGKSADRELPDNESAKAKAESDEKRPKASPKVVSPLEKFRGDQVDFAGGEFACVTDADPAKLSSELSAQKVPQKALRIRVMQGPKEAILCQAIAPQAPVIAPLYRRIERAARWQTAPFSEDAFERLAAEIRLTSPSAMLGLPRVIVFGESDLRCAIPFQK